MLFHRIVLLSGYHSRQCEQYFWLNQPDLGVSIIAEVMSSERDYKTKGIFHLVDNKKLTVEHGKVVKVPSLYSSLNDAFVINGVFYGKLIIDESMVPYFVQHSCKMFIRGKPIRYEYKICLCGSDGYPYHLSIYTGKSQDTGKPLGSRVVNAMVDILENNSTIVIDNF